MNTSTSCNAQELRPYSPNETNGLLQVCNASFKSSKAIKLAEAEGHFDINITLCREDEKEAIVSKKDESKGIWNTPVTKATITLPSCSPAFSLGAILSHPSKDEPPPLPLTETEPLQPPETKTVVSKEGNSAKLCSPLCLANPMPPRCLVPISPKSTILHLSKDKTSPSVKSVPT
ncbi:hypothetical protein AX14_006548 [Amanita brunnescens Koide BX004]|nr:hypothetical protein AX14_006548 [Amanita brunnescens Koide BX004]